VDINDRPRPQTTTANKQRTCPSNKEIAAIWCGGGWMVGCRLLLGKKRGKKRLKKKNGKKTQREEAIGKRVEEAHKLRQHSHLHIRIEVETVAVSGGGDQNK